MQNRKHKIKQLVTLFLLLNRIPYKMMHVKTLVYLPIFLVFGNQYHNNAFHAQQWIHWKERHWGQFVTFFSHPTHLFSLSPPPIFLKICSKSGRASALIPSIPVLCTREVFVGSHTGLGMTAIVISALFILLSIILFAVLYLVNKLIRTQAFFYIKSRLNVLNF